MSDTTPFGLFEAARQLGVSVRALRHAVRGGAIGGPSPLTATTPLPDGWLESARAAIEGTPSVLGGARRQAVPAFARYKGTSAWRKYAKRVHDYGRFQAKTAQSGAAPA